MLRWPASVDWEETGNPLQELKSRFSAPIVFDMKTSAKILTMICFSVLTLSSGSAHAMGAPFKAGNQSPAPGGNGPAANPPAPTAPSTPTAPPVPKPPEPARETPPIADAAAPLWEASVKNGKEWTAHVLNNLDTLGKDMMNASPTDVATFCPKYSQLSYAQKKDVWTYLMSIMVKNESGFDPNQQFKESFKDSNGKNVISRGLFQISIESSQGYSCGIKKAQELHDPYVNLSCGIRILNRWVSRDKRVAGKVNGGWRGGARYWSVLRTTSRSYPEIVAKTKTYALCR